MAKTQDTPSSLNNIGIIVTRPKGQSQNFINRLTKKGFTAFDLPGIHIAPAMDQESAIKMLSDASQYDYCLFTSQEQSEH